MHDGLARQHVYIPDSVVEDVDDRTHPPPRRTKQTTPPAFNRVSTEDLDMHAIVDGWRHRVHPSMTKTACSTKERTIPVHAGLHSVERVRKPVHPLADCECWTTGEREEANDEFRERMGREFSVDFKP